MSDYAALSAQVTALNARVVEFNARVVALEKLMTEETIPVVNEHEDRLDAVEQMQGDLGSKLETLHHDVANMRTALGLGLDGVNIKLDRLMTYWGVP